MIKEAIHYLLTLAKPFKMDIDGRPYTSDKLFPVPTPLPDIVAIHTLTGIKDYLTENPDGLDLDHVMVHVFSPEVVRVKSTLKPPFEDRAVYMDANYQQPVFKFGQYMDIEQFIIELQAKFIQDALTAQILQLVGTITDDQIQVYADDGVTQAVTAKNSVGMKAQTEVPNPVVLAPYRTFGEIAQPYGRFVMRMKSGTGTNSGRPAVALFEADGGAWQLQAIYSIRDWLRGNIPDQVPILA